VTTTASADRDRRRPSTPPTVRATAPGTRPDPPDRAGRQAALAKADGDEEAVGVDEPYLRAPNAGLGIGVDRRVMLLGDLLSVSEGLAPAGSTGPAPDEPGR
jgi:hypothetical protein